MTEGTWDEAAGRDVSRLVLAVLNGRALWTEPGQWLSGPVEETYGEMWDRAREVYGDDEGEYLFLDMLNIANHLLGYLEGATGEPADRWLARVRDDYIEPDPRSGTDMP
jgi:hypothetical protein